MNSSDAALVCLEIQLDEGIRRDEMMRVLVDPPTHACEGIYVTTG